MYLEIDEFKRRLRAQVVTDLTRDLDEAEIVTVLTEVITEAGQQFEGFFASKYRRPFVATQQVKGHVAKLGEPILYGRLRWNVSDDMLAEQAALQKLLMSGAYQLVDQLPLRSTDQNTNVRPASPAARISGSPKKLGREQTKGF